MANEQDDRTGSGDPNRAVRVDTKDAAALLTATDRNGQVNPVAYEAQRAILDSQRMGTVDADLLVRNVQQSPGFQTFDRDTFLKEVDQRLSTPAEQLRFSEALDTANITDTFVERQLERAGEAISDVYGTAKGGVEWGDRYLSQKMSWSYQRAEALSNDPDASAAERTGATLAREAVGKAQEAYGQTSGGVVHSLNTLKGFVDLGEMGYKFTTDENYRNLLISTAKLYAAETADDPSKPFHDVRNAATAAMDHWEKDLATAKAEGRERQFLGETQGAIGVEIAATLVPVSKLGKFGKVASSLERVGAEGVEEAAELAGNANRVLREAEGATPGRVIDGPGDVGQTMARSARATEAARDVIRAEIRVFRDEGKLDKLIDAVHKTGNVEGFLRSGELSAKELTEMLKHDQSLFAGKVDFPHALDISTRGVNFSTLSTSQLGDIGEAVHTYDLVKQGYTDIVSVKNASGHGIDLVARNPGGALEFSEIKTSGVGRAAGQRGDPAEFIGSRLQRAIDAQGHWDPKNTPPGMRDTARALSNEITDRTTGEMGDINAKWIKVNLGHKAGSTKLDIEKTVEEWVKPEKKTVLDNTHPDFRAFDRIRTAVRGTGRWNDGEVDNISAELLRNQKNDTLTHASLDKLHIHQDTIYAVRSPWGEVGPHFRVGTQMTEAAQKPAEQSLAQVDQINQQRTQEQTMAQPTRQQEGQTGPSIAHRMG